jgi:aspartoacylase
MMSMNKIEKVAIVGGTHGNELAGIYLVNHWLKNSNSVARDTFDTGLILVNHNAILINKRYTDCDLNRQFSSVSLADPSLGNYEQSRAKVINQLLGPKGQSKTDLVIDLHNTTSNMGPTLLIPQRGEFYDLMAIYLRQHMPQVIIYLDEDHKSNDEHHLLCTLGQHGVIVEVGPVAQGVLKHEVTEQMAKMTQLILDFVEAYNTNTLPTLNNETEAFRYLKSLTLPVDAKGNRIAMVHKNIEGNDFKAVEPGTAIFRTFDGKDINYEGAETVYPTFINEAAYYDNNLAMSLCAKTTIKNPLT